MTPHLQVPVWRTFEWWVMVFAVTVTPIDFSRIGLIDAAGPDVVKWITRFFAWFLPIAVLAPRWGSLLDVLRRPPASWLLIWAIYSSFSAIWGIAPVQAILGGLGVLGLCILTTWYVYSAGWQGFATAIVAGLTIVIVGGILLDVSEGIFVSGRSGGITTGPTTQGRLAALNIVVAGGLVWAKMVPRTIWLSIGISSIALLFSETRTAIIMAIIGLLYGGLRRLAPLNRMLLLVALIVLGASALGLAAAVTDDVASISERGDPTSISGRTDIWPIAIKFIAQRPVLGYGVGAQERILEQAANQGDLTFLAGTTHSIVLSALLSGGIVGLMILTTAFLSTFRHRRRVDAWVIAPIVTILVGGATEAIVHQPSVSIILIMGCMATIAKSPRWEPAPRRPLLKRGRSLVES